MLKKLTVRNFKAIQDMTIEFTPMTVLIGENGCGKSTVLQAIDFLRSIASRDIPEYLREKGWAFEELKSQLNGGLEKPIEFVTIWDFSTNGYTETMEWIISIDHGKEWVIKEKLTKHIDNGHVQSWRILSYRSDDQVDVPEALGKFNIQSSSLKYVAGMSITTHEIDKLLFFLSDSTSIELLSPDKMRCGKKLPYAQNIGFGGEALAYCIEKMNDNERRQLDRTVSDLTGSHIEIQTADLGSKIELSATIKADEDTMSVDSLHLSDGFLRIIAFAAISMEKNAGMNTGTKNGMILLDEIENGINIYLTEKIISMLRNLVKKSGRQVIITTHSPVMLNDFKPEEIAFLWKGKNGSAHSKKLFDTEDMRETLAFLNPGEIWENFGKDTILTKLNINPKDR